MSLDAGLVLALVIAWAVALALFGYALNLEVRHVDGTPRLVVREKDGEAGPEAGSLSRAASPDRDGVSRDQSGECDPSTAIRDAFKDRQAMWNGYPVEEARVGGSLFWRV